MKHSLLIFLCVFMFACSGNQVSIPDNVLPKEQMAKVMVDVHLLEASMNLNLYNPQKVAAQGSEAIFNTDVLKKNGITKKQYDESFIFYSKNPQLLGEVYQLVLNELSKMQAQVMHEK